MTVDESGQTAGARADAPQLRRVLDAHLRGEHSRATGPGARWQSRHPMCAACFPSNIEVTADVLGQDPQLRPGGRYHEAIAAAWPAFETELRAAVSAPGRMRRGGRPKGSGTRLSKNVILAAHATFVAENDRGPTQEELAQALDDVPLQTLRDTLKREHIAWPIEV